MRKISQEELNNIIECHRNWLFDKDVPKSKKHKADLSGVDLSGVDLYNVNLTYANLIGADLSNANLSDAKLSDANLIYASLDNANLYGANLNNANLVNTNLNDAILSNAYLINAILAGADLRGASLICTNLHNANLVNANLNGAKLTGANLGYANLANAELFTTDLSDVILSGANLTDTKLICTKGALLEYREGKILTEDIIGYKKCYNNRRQGVIVTLSIPKGAIVFSINGNKCRTNKAKVIAIDNDTDRAFSTYRKDYYSPSKYLSYYVGDEITVYNFNCKYNVECGSGIHFFMTKEEAEFYII